MFEDVKAASVRLDVSEKTIRRLVNSERLEAIRVGRSIRIPKDALPVRSDE